MQRAHSRAGGKLLAVGVLIGVTFALDASAVAPVRVALAGKALSLTVGRAWTARLAVQPASFAGAVRVTATGPKRIEVRATGRRGSYRARVVFPVQGGTTRSVKPISASATRIVVSVPANARSGRLHVRGANHARSNSSRWWKSCGPAARAISAT